jgi:hypothetical protein
MLEGMLITSRGSAHVTVARTELDQILRSVRLAQQAVGHTVPADTSRESRSAATPGRDIFSFSAEHGLAVARRAPGPKSMRAMRGEP